MKVMKKEKKKQVYNLTIKPALEPKERHKIEHYLEELGYQWIGGGTDTDMSQCDILFKS